MRTWPTAADWAQRCLSEFFAQVWRQKGSALRHCLAPPCAGWVAHAVHGPCCHRQCVGAAPSHLVRHLRRNGVRSPAVCLPSGGHREAARPACQPDVRPRDDTARAVAGAVVARRPCLSLVHAASQPGSYVAATGAHARSEWPQPVGRPSGRVRPRTAVSGAPLHCSVHMRSAPCDHCIGWRVHSVASRAACRLASMTS